MRSAVLKMSNKEILLSYSKGEISRSEAMNLLGFDWYGDLLDALAAANIERPTLPENERAVMVSYAKKILGHGEK